MTQRELALYETVKILLNQLISSGVLDYKQTRETLKQRGEAFDKSGYEDAAAMMGTLRMACEPKRLETASPHPMAAQPHTTDLRHAVILDI